MLIVAPPPVGGAPVTAYASIDDLSLFGLPADALASVPDAAKTAAIEAASRLLDSYLEARYPTPYTSVGTIEKLRVVEVAIYTLMNGRGFNPSSRTDVNIRLRYEDAVGWMTKVSQGVAHASVVSPELVAEPVEYETARIITSPKQGW